MGNTIQPGKEAQQEEMARDWEPSFESQRHTQHFIPYGITYSRLTKEPSQTIALGDT